MWWILERKNAWEIFLVYILRLFAVFPPFLYGKCCTLSLWGVPLWKSGYSQIFWRGIDCAGQNFTLPYLRPFLPFNGPETKNEYFYLTRFPTNYIVNVFPLELFIWAIYAWKTSFFSKLTKKTSWRMRFLVLECSKKSEKIQQYSGDLEEGLAKF